MSDELVSFEVNGQTLQARPGSMLIEATDAAGITVPRFCYHHKLSVAANCRMCLVEVERSAKPLPACATPVAAGMKAWTRSEKARAAQQDVMEFLLINHPLDCPICDQGGECELQDVSMGFGNSKSHFVEMKRAVRDKDIGPLIETAMTRCIHCTRCVRFGEEIAGLRELGRPGCSDHMEIGTYVEKSVSSELSGNVIDLCPVGALTAKPSRYAARAWEMVSHEGVALHDAVGSNVFVHTFDGKVIRVVPRENGAVNECWISDRDRFSYQGLHSAERITQPQIKRDGQWRDVGWQEALDYVAHLLKQADPAKVGALAAPTSTLEELYLFQKLMRGLGVKNIDSRLRQVDVGDQLRIAAVAGLGLSLAALETQQAVLLVGSNVRQDLPMANHRLRKAVLAGGVVLAVNPRQVDFNYPVSQRVAPPREMVGTLAALALAVCGLTGGEIPEELSEVCAGIEPDGQARAMASQLHAAERSAVFMGQMAFQHPQLSVLRALVAVISSQTGSVCGYLPEANALGCQLAGVMPHRLAGGALLDQVGLSAGEMLAGGMGTFVLMNAEVDDCANPHQAYQSLLAADNVVVVAPFANRQVREYASVLLPAAAFTETAGTWVNAEGNWQTFKGAAAPPGQARPVWKILRVLGNALRLPEFDYVSTEEVTAELKLELQGVHPDNRPVSSGGLQVVPWQQEAGSLQRIGDVHMYRSDALVRRAGALQAMLPQAAASMHPQQLDSLGILPGDLVRLEQGGGCVQLPVEADAAVPAGCVWVQSGTEASNALGAAFGSIQVSKV